MIYALYDFDSDDWILIGDYATTYDVFEYWTLLCQSSFYSRRTIALWSVGTWNRSAGTFGLEPRQRIATHEAIRSPGGSCGGQHERPPQVEAVPDESYPVIGFFGKLGNQLSKIVHFQKQKKNISRNWNRLDT